VNILRLKAPNIKVKAKVRRITGHEGPEGEYMYGSIRSLTSAAARWGWVVNATPRLLTSGRDNQYPLYRRLDGAHGRFGWTRKISPPSGFFLCSLVLCTSSVLGSFVLIVLSFSFFVFTYKTRHKHPCFRGDSDPQSQQAIGCRPWP
jgi:hypothetical protein